MKHYSIFVCLMFAFMVIPWSIQRAMASDNDDIPDAFVVYISSGEKVSYMLVSYPVVTFDADNVILSTTNNRVEYAKSDVAKFTLEHVTTDGIKNEATSDTQIRQHDGTFLFEGFAPNTVISVYDTAGHLVDSASTSSDGSAMIATNAYKSGIYILKADNKSYKFIKH